MTIKKITTLALMLFASAFLALGFFSNTFTKQIPEMLTFSKTDTYDKLWKRVDSCELKGLTESALTVVDVIYKKAKLESNAPQFVKSILHRMKFESYKEEFSLEKSIFKLRDEVNEAHYPIKPVLQSILADAFWQYYQNNRWKFYDRTTTVNFKNDIEIKGGHSWMSYELKNINYSPDGTLICGSNYESINIWNVRDGNLFNNLKGHKGQVNFCAFSPDGKMIASAGKDKTVKIWNLKENKEIFDYKTHTASINSVAFNKNSNLVLSASNDCTTKMFHIDTGNPSLILEKHNDFVRQAVFGFNDDLIITTGD